MSGKPHILFLSILLLSFLTQKGLTQCELITDNYSGQKPSSVCAPVDLTMDVRYKFITPVNPSKVEILYVWNDGIGSTTLVPAISQGDTVFTASQTHNYPPADNCSYTAEAYVVYDGNQCVSSSRQEQTFSAWAQDNENGGVITTDPVVAQFCEGDDIVDVTFRDNSNFNCNINVEPDKPNRLFRWVQFIYGTTSIGGDRIPNVTVDDGMGNTYTMTDSDGNSLGPVAGPIVPVPIPADGPNQTSWSISAPAGGVAGDIFEITMRNWNICNPYDATPFDSLPPGDTIDGDNPPITTTALIEIITTPPVITNPSLEFCVNNPIHLNLSTSGGDIRWYSDSTLTTLIHTGNSFDPTGPPTYVDNSVAGAYSYYVIETVGDCESAPSKISFEIFDTPTPPADAGADRTVCSDTITIYGSNPVIGNGIWSTTGNAVIDDSTNPVIHVSNLDPGPNLFRWTLTNGPCMSVDEVIITRDLQPGPAVAGPDQSFCDDSSAALHANTPTNNGNGSWTIIQGSGTFSDPGSANTNITSLSSGENRLVWTIESQYGVCRTTSDTLSILRDLTPDMANAGPDRGVCDSASVSLQGNPLSAGSSGQWTRLSGSATIIDTGLPNTTVNGLSYGSNTFRWTIISQFGLCPGSSDEVTITRDEAPVPAFAGFDQQLCNTTTTPLGANTASVGTGTWSVVTNPSGVNPVFNPSVNDENATVEISPGNEGLYAFAWTITNASCVTSDTLQVDFGIPPTPADAGEDDTICGTVAGLEGNIPAIGMGSWSKVEGPGNITFLPNASTHNATVRIENGKEGLYRFEWRITSGSCPPETDTVALFFKPMPGVPSASDVENCGPTAFTLNSSIGTNGNRNYWYDSGSGGNLISISTSYITPILNVSTSYWVATYNDTTQCESARRRVNAVIYQVPAQPVTQNAEHCGPGNINVLATIGANGSTNRWYDSISGGTLLSTSKNYFTPLLDSSATFWVSSYNDSTGCEGSRTQANVTIHPVPGLPTGNNESLCGPGSITLTSSIGSDGTTNRWWDSSTGGNILDTSLTYTTPTLNTTNIYWVSSYNELTGCESGRLELQAIINPVPDAPNVDDVINCGPDTLLMTSTPGQYATTSRWYDWIIGGNLLAEADNYTTSYLTSDTSYWVSSYNDTTQCESNRVQAKAIILPEPGPNPIQGAGTVGLGQTNVIYSVVYHAGSNYDWNIPPGINVLLENQNFVILEFPNLGTYNISVQETNTVTGCPGPLENKAIVVNENLLYINLTPVSGKACVGNNLQITAVPSGGTPSYTFLWTGDTQYLSATDVSNPVFNAESPGTYTFYLRVIDINGKEATDSLEVNVLPNPFTKIMVNDTVVCANNVLPLNTIMTGGSGVYNLFNWTGDISPLSSTTIPNPEFKTLVKGFYHLKFTLGDDQGCTAVDSVIIFNDIPKSAFTSDAEPHCSPVIFNFENSSEGAISYLWNFGDNDSSTEENPSHEFINLGSSVEFYNVRLTAISINGCEHVSNQYVTVYPNPVTQITSSPDVACHPANVLLSATPGGYNYQWSYGDGITEDGGYNAHHIFTNYLEKDTVYNIKLVTTSFFDCLDTSYTSITVHPSPEARFTATPVSQMFPDKTVNIVNQTQDRNWSYKWYFGDKSTSSEKDPGSHDYEKPDDYTISLVVSGTYCSDSTSANIEILPHPPEAKFEPVKPGCMPLTVHFKNSSSYSNSYLWDFGDGAVSNKPDPVYTYYESGEYKITLKATGPGGTDSYSTQTSVYILPKAFFDIAPRYVYVNDKAVHFFNLSDNGDIYEWDFGDGTTSTDYNPKHVYTKEGTYTVTLNVWTSNNCYDLYEMETAVIVEPSGKIVFPNAFRPDSPIEENRVFKPAVMDQVEEYHLMIFNRWGELLYESFDRDIGWDGYVDSKPAKQDVYVWKVEGKYSSGQSFVKSGDVTLLR